jgi:hypothetical protein
LSVVVPEEDEEEEDRLGAAVVVVDEILLLLHWTQPLPHPMMRQDCYCWNLLLPTRHEGEQLPRLMRWT